MGKDKKDKGSKGKKKPTDGKPVVGQVRPGDAITPDKSRVGKVEEFYEIGKELGRGGMSVVYEGLDKASNTRWAVKFIDKNVVDDMEVLQREIDIMKRLSHKNILQLREVFETPEQIQMVTELVTGGELFEKIVEAGSYSEADAGNIIRQLVEGVLYLHEHGVAHRDLKPENLLVGGEDEEEIKIADFGLSKKFKSDSGSSADGGILKTSCGTPDYVAPEVLQGKAYDKAVDLWSVGVITYILICGFPPFYAGNDQAALFKKIMDVDYSFPDPEWTNVSSHVKDFIKKLLVADPVTRLNAKQCLEHPWLVECSKNAAASAGKKEGAGGELRSLESVRNLKKYNDERKKPAGK